MNSKEKTFIAIASFALVIIILFFPLRLTLFNESFYHSQFVKNNVYDEINQTTAQDITINLMSFFRGEASLNYFNENEQSHLLDVKNIFDKIFFVLFTAIILFVSSLVALFFVNKKDFQKNTYKLLFIGGLSSLALICLLFLASLNFSITFDGFHKLFFPQGNYAFPSTSLLITLFPEIFFRNFFVRLLLNSLLFSVIAMAPQYLSHRLK